MTVHEAAVFEAHRQMVRAMLERNIAVLDAQLADDFTLTHITGYRQPKRAWLEAIRSGQMRYHAAKEVSVRAKVSDDKIVLVGRSIVDATISGVRGTWNLQLTTTYQHRGVGQWVASDTVATTF